MPNRETWDWQSLEPDETVTMTMLFPRTQKDDGLSKEKDYIWHRYPVSVSKTEWTMFTPSEHMHIALQNLGVEKKGDIFRVTKKIDGWNKKTKKSYTYYEIESKGTKLRTDDMNGKPSETPQEQVKRVSSESEIENKFRKWHRPAFRTVMDDCMEYLKEQCPLLFEDCDSIEAQEKLAQAIIGVARAVAGQVSTLIIQNGGKQ